MYFLKYLSLYFIDRRYLSLNSNNLNSLTSMDQRIPLSDIGNRKSFETNCFINFDKIVYLYYIQI